MKFRHAKVKTLDSHSYPGLPLRVEIDGDSMDVDFVIEHWREAYTDPSFYPQEYYKVQASNKKIYVLRYSTLFKSWWVSDFGVKT